MKDGPKDDNFPSKKKEFLFFHKDHNIQAPLLLTLYGIKLFFEIFRTLKIFEKMEVASNPFGGREK